MWHVGKETVVTLDGKRYTFARFTRALLREWLEWADTVIPDPLEGLQAVLASLPDTLAEQLVRHTIRTIEPRKSFQNAAFLSLWSAPEGVRYALALALVKHHPELSQEERERTVYLLGMEQDLSALRTRLEGMTIRSEQGVEVAYLRELGLLGSEMRSPAQTREDWVAIDHNMGEVFGLTPQQIDDMTFPEIAAMCNNNDTDKVDPTTYIQAYRKLTPSQQLEMEMRKRF